MKYMITWNERPQGSPAEYENAQKRILEVFSPWKAPANFKIESFVICFGDWGGYMLMECDDRLEVHKFCPYCQHLPSKPAAPPFRLLTPSAWSWKPWPAATASKANNIIYLKLRRNQSTQPDRAQTWFVTLSGLPYRYTLSLIESERVDLMYPDAAEHPRILIGIEAKPAIQEAYFSLR